MLTYLCLNGSLDISIAIYMDLKGILRTTEWSLSHGGSQVHTYVTTKPETLASLNSDLDHSNKTNFDPKLVNA